MKSISEVRPSPLAGQWYPADPEQLAESVDGYLQAARLPALTGEVVGVIAPHAGHLYSGAVAGYAFAALRGAAPDLVAVLAPMHYPYPAPLLTSAHAAYGTPLGTIPVDQPALEELDRLLQADLGIGLQRVSQDPEHALEIELPFLQRSLSAPFHLLPVMLRDQRPEVAQSLGRALAEVLRKRKAALVISTDLSHFFTQEVAEGLDQEVLKQVEALDPLGIFRAEEEGRGFACGYGALAAGLWAGLELGADRVQVLHHATSGDVTGDYERVVGYGAAVILRLA